MIDFTKYRLTPLHVRSPLDPRDFKYAAAAPVDVDAAIKTGQLPSSVDLHALGLAPDVWDQGAEGSCTGHGTAGGVVNSLLKAGIVLPQRPSPRFIYWNARVTEHTQNIDNGAYERDDLQSLIDLGVCLESDCPYVPGDFAQPPSQQAFTDAGQYKAARYESLQGWQWIAQSLGAEHRFVISCAGWYQNWYYPTNGFIQVPAAGVQPIGGHCWGWCGYKYLTNPFDGQYKLHFRLHNSWSAGWGDQGHTWVDAAGVDSLLWERWIVVMQGELQQPVSHPLTVGGLAAATASLSFEIQRGKPSPPDPGVLQGISTQFARTASLLREAGIDPASLLN